MEAMGRGGNTLKVFAGYLPFFDRYTGDCRYKFGRRLTEPETWISVVLTIIGKTKICEKNMEKQILTGKNCRQNTNK
jgi:hypothetical protein